MKNLFILLTLTAALVQSANAAQAPQCYNDAGVSAEEPFMLTLIDLDPYQLGLVSEDLMSGELLTVTNSLEFGETTILVLAVNAAHIGDDPSSINESVYKQVRATAKKYQIPSQQYSLECNGTVTGQPRAGGAN